MTDRLTQPCDSVSGEIVAPGDKSISHRMAILSALAEGTSHIENYLVAEDCLHSLAAMSAMGADVKRDGVRVTIRGTGGQLTEPDGPLDMGNSGTGMRLLSGLLAGQPFGSELTGDASLLSRPMARIRDPLERMGATVDLLGRNDCGPIRITGGGLHGMEYALPVASAQVKGCILLAGLFADGATTVVEPRKTRDHTERALRYMNVPIVSEDQCIRLPAERRDAWPMPARSWRVPGDFSSAAFWLVAACRPDSAVTLHGVGLNPRRTAFLDVLRRMGANITIDPDETDGWEPSGTIHVRGGRLTGTVIEGDEIPNLIDELPLAAVAGAMAEGETVIRDAAELRVKESDRITATTAFLRAMGVRVSEKPDGMHIVGRGTVDGGAAVDSAGDHRIAMAAAVLAMSADTPVMIRHTDCVTTSYPGFWGHLGELCCPRNQ